MTSSRQPSLFSRTRLSGSSFLFGACEPSVTEQNATASLVGIPYDQGSSYRRGARQGPNWIRMATTPKNMTPFSEAGVDITTRHAFHDWGNLHGQNGSTSFPERIQAGIRQASQRTSLLLVLGGDHSITPPCIAGLRSLDPSSVGVIYFDAHTDYYPSLKGDQDSHASTVYRLLSTGTIRPDTLVIIGERAGPPDHTLALRDLGVRIVTTDDLFRRPSSWVVQAIKEQVGSCRHVYVSIDLDVFDPAYAPGVGTPEPAGVTPRQVLELFAGFHDLPVRGIDLVEVIPGLDHAGITGSLCAKLIKELLAVLPPSSGSPR